MAKIDFHTHSKYSIDSLTSVYKLYKAAKKKGLTGIALTDHNTYRGIAEFKQILREENDEEFILVPGMELMSEKGEVSALFLNEEIKARTFDDIVDEVKSQGGVVSIPHPFDTIRKASLKMNQLTKLQVKKIDAIEVFNSRNVKQSANRAAKEFAELHQKAKLAGSDAHWTFEIGNAYVELSAQDAEEARKQVLAKKTAIDGKPTNPAVLAVTKIVKTWKKVKRNGL